MTWIIALHGILALRRLKYLDFKFGKNPLENNRDIRLEKILAETPCYELRLRLNDPSYATICFSQTNVLKLY
jgi:hypothetical protein